MNQCKIENLTYHNRRFNYTRWKFFNLKSELNLANYITLPESNSLFKCRIIYSKEIDSIEFTNYTPKKIQSFNLVEIDFDYSFKYLDRAKIDSLDRANCDDILMIRDGYLLDSSIANIAIFNKESWLTPKNPLLKGCYRQSLLDKNLLREAKLKVEDLKYAKEFAILNSMVKFKKIENFTFRGV